jgi:hypothetical protein
MLLPTKQHRAHVPNPRCPLDPHLLAPPAKCSLASNCRIHDTEDKYYADGEDAYGLRLTFSTGEKAAADKAAAAEKQAAAAAAAGTPDKASPGGRKGGKRR